MIRNKRAVVTKAAEPWGAGTSGPVVPHRQGTLVMAARPGAPRASSPARRPRSRACQDQFRALSAAALGSPRGGAKAGTGTREEYRVVHVFDYPFKPPDIVVADFAAVAAQISSWRCRGRPETRRSSS